MTFTLVRLNTLPYSDPEVTRLSKIEQFKVRMLGKEKVVGQEILDKIPDDDSSVIKERVRALCNLNHPTPIIALDSERFRDSFIFDSPFKQHDPGSLMELVLVRRLTVSKDSQIASDTSNNKNEVQQGKDSPDDGLAWDRWLSRSAEKRQLILEALDLKTDEQLYAFFGEQIRNARSLGYEDPTNYIREQLRIKIPGVENILAPPSIPPLKITSFISDPDPVILCRVIGRDALKVGLFAEYYRLFHNLTPPIKNVSNEFAGYAALLFYES